MNKIIMAILLTNTVIGLFYLIASLLAKKAESVKVLLHFLVIVLCPIIGPILIAVGYLSEKFLKPREVDLSEMSFSHEKLSTEIAPDEETEMLLTPLQDMFLVGSNQDKRRAMLYALKQDMERYLSGISQGIADEDSETSHYAATSLMKYTSDFTANIQRLAVLYEQDPADEETNRVYADIVYQYLNSNPLMPEMDLKKYRYLYWNLMENRKRHNPEGLLLADYGKMMKISLLLENPGSAEEWVEAGGERFPKEEQSYLNALEFYIRTGRREDFHACMEALKKSDIPLSPEGLSLIRFFAVQPKE